MSANQCPHTKCHEREPYYYTMLNCELKCETGELVRDFQVLL